MIKTIWAKQSGFVLIIVLVAVLIISAMAMLMLNQASTDTKASVVGQQKTQLTTQAWQAITPLWQLNHTQLQDLAAHSGSWLGQMLGASAQPIVGWYACGQVSAGVLGMSDGQSDQSSMTCPANLPKYHAYLTALDASHYLYKAFHPKLSASTQAAPTDAPPSDASSAYHYYLLQLYAVATSQSHAKCQTASMYERQAIRCYGDMGVPVQAVGANWLIVIEQQISADTADTDVNHPKSQAAQAKPKMTIIKLGVHDVDIIRE